MSALAWLFGLGFLAITGPLLFHLIRRTPKGQVEFSSLMFLRPSPPTLTRRSRLDNLLLLFLRIAAVALIATAFMRPFFNSNVRLDFSDIPGTKIAVLLDSSASMRRGELWEKALKQLREVVSKAEENDEIAVFTFDKRLHQNIGFTKKAEFKQLVAQPDSLDAGPGWNVSDLGGALVDVANRLLSAERSENESDNDADSLSKQQIVVLSDMQAGSPTASLQNFQWPSQIKVKIETIETDSTTNATLQLLPIDESDPQQNTCNVLVRNSNESTNDQFSVAWQDGSSPTVPFLVPPGKSRILNVPRDSASLDSCQLTLTGDDTSFDNQFYSLPPARQTISIGYLGDESANDPEAMLYYFKRCLIDSPTTAFDLQTFPSDKSMPVVPVDFMVVARPVSEPEANAIDSLLKDGMTLLVALDAQSKLESTSRWTKVSSGSNARTSGKDDYAMLGSIDFAHPLFAPFSGPQFNDFTQLRFWDFIRPTLPDHVHVLARFDDDTPALWHQLFYDKSDVYVLGCGWQPSKSQLALSSKFLPLILRMIELSNKTPTVMVNRNVGQRVNPPKGYDRLVTPEGDTQFIESSIDTEFESPGIYSLASSTNPGLPDLQFAVNIESSESQTSPMPIDQISALGVNLGSHQSSTEEFEQRRKLLDAELENRQKIWKWLILLAVGIIIAESWLAGKTDRSSATTANVSQEGSSDE